jgi:hypothetical protein
MGYNPSRNVRGFLYICCMDYQKIYNDLISKVRSENRVKGLGIYYEEHHIKPVCMGGKGKLRQWRFHPNIILLTAQEHFISHKLLCEIYPNNKKLKYALDMFLNVFNKLKGRNIKIGSREYARIKEEVSKLRSDEMTGLRVGELHPMFGKKQSDEAKKNMSINTSGDKNPMKRPEVVHKLTGEGNGMFGRKHSKETKQKIRERAVGRVSPRKGVKLTDETKQLLREKNLGKKLSNETKQKIQKLNVDDVFYIRNVFVKGDKTFGATALGIKFNVHAQTILNIINRKVYIDI